jgi:hypothetical protein
MLVATVALIEELRRLRWTSTGILGELRSPTSTVCVVVVRLGLHRLSRLEPIEPSNRYCRRHPGELLHIDVKKPEVQDPWASSDRPGPYPQLSDRRGVLLSTSPSRRQRPHHL